MACCGGAGSCRARCRSRTCSIGAAGVLRQRLLEPGAHPQHLVGLDLDVGGLRRSRRRPSPAGGSGRARSAARSRLPGAPAPSSTAAAEAAWPRQTVWMSRLDVLHRVVDRRQRRERATGRVDVHDDVAVGVLRSSTISWAMMSSAEASSTCTPRKMMRSSKSLVYGSVPLHAVGRALLELRKDVAAAAGRRRGRAGRLAILGVHAHGSPDSGRHGRRRSGAGAAAAGAWPALVTTWSTKPYSLASSAVNQRSRSESLLDLLDGLAGVLGDELGHLAS